ncbi:HPP family protein [Streptomyces sp. NPDC101132]|uniref:HPP family protein n=1 Tax=Streptomyces sp. NPDC101132 TaxID=3366110 RepID=UPI00380AABEB
MPTHPAAPLPHAPEPPVAVPVRAPARPTPVAAAHSISAVTAVLLTLVGIGAMIHEPVLIPSLAASAALVHSAPALPLAQPRSVIAGHLIGALVGYGVLAGLGSSPWAAAVAGGLTLALTMAARTPHSPGCASSVIVVLQTPEPDTFVPLLLGATVLLVLTGCLASRIRPGATRYPAYWW